MTPSGGCCCNTAISSAGITVVVGSKALAEGIAVDLPIEEFHDHREILPAAIGPEIRDVACPGFERHFRGEVLLQDIRCNGFFVIRVRRNLELSGAICPNV